MGQEVVRQRRMGPIPCQKGQKMREADRRWIGLFVFMFFLVVGIESTLAFRLWVQLSGEHLDSGWKSLVYSLSGMLVRPFARYETFNSPRTSGILQFSGLVATDVYLIGGLVTLVLVYFLRYRLTPLWNLLWWPPSLVARGLLELAKTFSFGIARLADSATIFFIERWQLDEKKHFHIQLGPGAVRGRDAQRLSTKSLRYRQEAYFLEIYRLFHTAVVFCLEKIKSGAKRGFPVAVRDLVKRQGPTASPRLESRAHDANVSHHVVEQLEFTQTLTEEAEFQAPDRALAIDEPRIGS
jgi:hypothetical protein